MDDEDRKAMNDALRILSEKFPGFNVHSFNAGFSAAIAHRDTRIALLEAERDKAEDCLNDAWKAIDPDYDGGVELYDLPDRLSHIIRPSVTVCYLCRRHASGGAYLKRVSPLGQTPAIMECAEGTGCKCDGQEPSQDEKLLRAVAEAAAAGEGGG